MPLAFHHMPSPHIPNRLRAHRKRSCLFQKDIAFLLGVQCGAKVSRYEALVREPNLKTLLAYEAIFDESIRDLFPALWRAIELEIVARAKLLLHRMSINPPKGNSGRRRQALSKIAMRKEVTLLNK